MYNINVKCDAQSVQGSSLDGLFFYLTYMYNINVLNTTSQMLNQLRLVLIYNQKSSLDAISFELLIKVIMYI